ncbi:hypothetical protein QN277_021477 [Acacia crassicarpa]|uniref:Retrotransposon Copia-like N-terminal domain-containing protein n=1 Tax=Acacia crassicarpa TaxID=499986 RepID=A0AAE1JQC0_9FABA|nr:hypothetical protein QN277_021477 [Acacia crassicarpa]
MASEPNSSSSSLAGNPNGDSTLPSPDSIQNVGNPYYLHPNENPSLVLVSSVLTGPNYHSWARAMKMALMSKNKLRFIDRSSPVPSSVDPLYPAWERCNMMVLSWLTRSLSPTIAQSILWIDQASEVWEDLRARFSQNDVFRLADLQEDIQNLKQGDLSVSDYFTKLKILWDELLVIRPIVSCSCNPRCHCGMIDLYKNHLDQDYVIRFLKGLSDRFSTVKSQIMLVDPLPNINRVFSLVTQQERELGFQPVEAVTLFNKSSTPRTGNQNHYKPNSSAMGKQCTYCGKPRHTEATCYRKHGFPPGFKFRNSSVNSVIAAESASADKGSFEPHKVVNPNYSFTPDQYQKLLALVQSDKSSIPPSASVNHISANDVSLSNPPSTFQEDDWFS